MEKTKINEKEAGIGPFKKPCWQGPKKDERLRFETDLLVERIENRFRDDEAVRPYILRSLLPLPPPFTIVSQICPCFKITVKASERERESKKAGKEKGSKMEEKHSSNFHPIDLHSSIEAPYFSDTEGRTYPYLPTYLEGINSSWNFSSGWTSIIEMTWHKLRLEQLELAESTFSTKAIWKNVTVPIWCLWSNWIYRNVSKQILNESGAGVNLWPILQIFYDCKLRL